MKKILSMMLAVVLLGALCITASAEGVCAEVYVTVADDKGELALAQEKITVTDIDGDGVLTLDEALFAAHEAKFEGGAAAGYATENTQWGISLVKLWGVENGGSYGYYLNNASAMGLSAEVKDGDLVSAFVYTDLNTWSDMYCFFDNSLLTAAENTEITLTLKGAGFDENWNPITLPIADAVITVDGVATEVVTDAEGRASISFDKAGRYVVSAESESGVLVPPALVVTVKEEAPATGIGSVCVWMAVFALCALGLAMTAKKHNEN